MTRNRASNLRFRPLPFVIALGTLAVPAIEGTALAQGTANPNCPPGSWFCAEPAPQQAPPSQSNLQPLPEQQAAPPPAAPPPPVVVYQPPPPTVIVSAPPREAPPPYVYRAPEWSRKNEWGLNLHLGGAMIGKGVDGDSGMGLVGAGLRFRPIPQLAFQGDLDFAGGRDYNGFRRSEVELALNALVFLNPRDRAQFYFLGGLGISTAHAVDDRNGFDGRSYDYGYLGVQGGVGMEYRASKHVALNVDLRAFVRGRVDDNARNHPEFTSTSGQATNTSGGGLLTGGITFYF